MNSFFVWFITFNFVNIAWIFFRAVTWEDAQKVLKGMTGFSELGNPLEMEAISVDYQTYLLIIAGFLYDSENIDTLIMELDHLRKQITEMDTTINSE